MSRLDEKTLDDVIQDAESDKETVREKAIKSLRETFAHPSAFARFNKRGERKGWLVVYQAVFTAYQAQLKKCISKLGSVSAFEGAGPSDRSLARLIEIASTLRYLVSNSKQYLTNRVLKPLLKHLCQGVVKEGKLVTAIASDYAHTIESVLLWKPHLQAVPDDTWHDILALSFNIVLNRAPRRMLEDHLDVEDPEGGCGYNEAEAASSLKRPRRDGVSTGGNARPGPSIEQGAVRQPISIQAPFMRIITLLLRSPTGPILLYPEDVNKEDPRSFPRRLLTYFSHFLQVHAIDSSLRHDYLSGLSAALSHYTLNCRLPVAVFSADAWHPLVAMWSAKDGEKSDDLVIILRMLFPALAAEPLGDEPKDRRIDAFGALWLAAEGIANRTSSNLGLGSLQSHVTEGRDDSITRKPFTSRTFQYGWGLSRTRALTWAALELQADCAEKVRRLRRVDTSFLFDHCFRYIAILSRATRLLPLGEKSRSWRTLSPHCCIRYSRPLRAARRFTIFRFFSSSPKSIGLSFTSSYDAISSSL